MEEVNYNEYINTLIKENKEVYAELESYAKQVEELQKTNFEQKSKFDQVMDVQKVCKLIYSLGNYLIIIPCELN